VGPLGNEVRTMTGYLLGIDPGRHGAIAVLAPDGTLVDVIDMPDATGAALGAHIRQILDDWQPLEIDAAWVEQVHAMPKQGVSSTFTFGKNYGAILGALGALGIPVHHVTPAHWKRTQRVNSDKASSRQRACELWPGQSSWFALVKHTDRAEAALIARHGQMAGEA
jgi:crossover junction endodeoxyribonuclease RuvC